MKRLIMSVAVAAFFLCGLQQAQAVPLAPGGSTAPGTLPTILPAGSVIASGSQTVTASGGEYTATVHYAVFKETGTGTLDFLYQVHNSAGSIDALTHVQNHGFAGSPTDVNTVLANDGFLAGSIFEAPTAGVTPTQATRTGSGDTIDWNVFANPIAPGSISSILDIRTDATIYQAGTSTVINDVPTNTFSFAPNPEPASLVLLGGCFAGLGCAGAWRRFRKPIPVVS